MIASSVARAGAPLGTLDKDAINELPVVSYEGDILLVQTQGELQQALSYLRDTKVLGFDTESRPSFKKGRIYPTSLVQLATAELAVLIRLTHVPFHESLATLLSDASILKVGVAIGDDMKALQQLYPFTPAGFIDLSVMAKRRSLQAQGLRTLAATLIGVRISKAAQCSNWEKRNLTPQQIRYAATDAWIGREIYYKLKDLDERRIG